MIKANELRIGNWVEMKTVLIGSKWEAIESELINMNDMGSGNGTYASYKPIPLTEEWLIKFGFDVEINVDNGDWYFKQSKVDVSFGLIKDDNGSWELYTGSRKIKYVHQLQNLYFALTGEELENK